MRRTKWLVTAGAALAMLAGQAAFAQAAATGTAAKPANSQQEKMKTCNADATSKGLKGTDRKAYMKSCLSDQPAPAAKTNSQQEKMKSCNADATAKGLKGADRKSFMSSCLKGAHRRRPRTRKSRAAPAPVAPCATRCAGRRSSCTAVIAAGVSAKAAPLSLSTR
jgi:hypothetical protein